MNQRPRHDELLGPLRPARDGHDGHYRHQQSKRIEFGRFPRPEGERLILGLERIERGRPSRVVRIFTEDDYGRPFAQAYVFAVREPIAIITRALDTIRSGELREIRHGTYRVPNDKDIDIVTANGYLTFVHRQVHDRRILKKTAIAPGEMAAFTAAIVWLSGDLAGAAR